MHAGIERRESRPQRHPGRLSVVLAAVDDSDLAVPVIERAAGHARVRGQRLLVVTVIPIPAARDLGEGGRLAGDLAAQDDALRIIGRVQPTLDECGVAYQIQVRGYLARGGPRRQARRVAGTVLRVAGEAGADVIVVGRRRGRSAPATSVAARIACGAPTHVHVSFVQHPRLSSGRVPDRRHAAPRSRPDGNDQAIELAPPPGERDRVVLTGEGKRLLAARAQQLRNQVIPQLASALADREHDRKHNGAAQE